VTGHQSDCLLRTCWQPAFGDDLFAKKSSDDVYMVRFNFGFSFYKHNKFLDQLREWQQVEKNSAMCI
jgi:hypothetical protein